MLTKFFAKKRETIQALKNVSFKIDQHDIFGVIGYSGAGKSTLVRLVNQLETVSDGQVIVDGHEIDTYKEKIYVILKRYRYDLSTFQFA